MWRFLVLILVISGCKPATRTTMLPPRNVPADSSDIHPWIADLLQKDASAVAAAVNERLSDSATPATACMVDRIRDFIPCRIEFSKGVGYLLCLKRSVGGHPSGDVTDQLYLAQPLPDDVLEARIQYYDESARKLMREFLSKYAGYGEEMEGEFAGQFVWAHDEVACDVAYDEPERLGEWKETRILYWARNGDLALINPHGATAWHVMETNEVVPLFDSFSDFVQQYADFRGTSEVFDSWSSRESLGRLVTE